MTNSNCKYECYNYELCKALGNVPNNLTAFGSCKFYKNKSLVLDLPCKVGDYAYRVVSTDYDAKPVGAYKIVPIRMSSNLAIVKAMKEQQDWKTMTRPQIGWLFFDKAEAEAKLKELKENAKV